jgi:hypothetical protein
MQDRAGPHLRERILEMAPEYQEPRAARRSFRRPLPSRPSQGRFQLGLLLLPTGFFGVRSFRKRL